MATVTGTTFRSSVTWVLLSLWLTLGRLHIVSAQSGFLSIDCGATSQVTDTTTGLVFVTDDGYISTGVNKNVSGLSDLGWSVLTNARYFTEGRSKYCYVLPVTENTGYLVRADFLFGDLEISVPTNYYFDMSIDSNVVYTLELGATDAYSAYVPEFIIASTSSQMAVCLITGVGNPFISGLSIRPLLPTMYQGLVFDSMYSQRISGINCGAAVTDPIVRYPDDTFDRLWYPPNSKILIDQISTTNTVSYAPNSLYENPPPKIFQTAWEDPSFWFQVPFPSLLTEKFYSALYFRDISTRNSTDVRTLDILFNGVPYFTGYTIDLTPRELYSIGLKTSQPYVNFTFSPNATSTLGALLNGAELHAIYPANSSVTQSSDIETLNDLRQNLGLLSWTGDPCVPISWDWLNCSYTSNTARVTQLKLSYYGVNGTLPASVGNLTALTDLWLDNNFISGPLPELITVPGLRTLHFENNSFTGTIPTSYGNLQYLTELYLKDNNLSGPLPNDLVNKTGLILQVDQSVITGTGGEGNSTTPSSNKKSSGSGAIIGAIAGVVVVIFIVVFVTVCCCCVCKKKKDNLNETVAPLQTSSTVSPGSPLFAPSSDVSIGAGAGTANASHHVKSTRAFSQEEVQVATNNFKRKIGEGGFGPVFYGELPAGGKVAVKVNSETSGQGSAEFSTEVSLLSRVHHVNLVSLVGYCNEGNQQILIYDYMQNGTLREHLYGNGVRNVLDWRTRLSIALDSARGLEYLHNDCSPKIIHRDVKSNNILLNERYVAKVADFGISKLAPDEDLGNGVSTMVKGTMGYLDPEYFQTNKLSQKSDVYAFGVVLLEIISGRGPIDDSLPDPTQWNLVEYARSMLGDGNLEALVDKSLWGTYNVEAMWKLAELAMFSVEPQSVNRYDMRQVVREVAEAVEMENTRTPIGHNYSSGYRDGTQSSVSSSNPSTQFSLPDNQQGLYEPSVPPRTFARAPSSRTDVWNNPRPR